MNVLENCISDVGVLWSNSQVSDDYYIATIILHSYVRRMNPSAYAFVFSLGLSDNLRMYIVDKQITGLPYWDVVDKVISNIKQSPASLLDAQQMVRYRQKYYKVLAEKVPRVVYVHASADIANAATTQSSTLLAPFQVPNIARESSIGVARIETQPSSLNLLEQCPANSRSTVSIISSTFSMTQDEMDQLTENVESDYEPSQ